MRDDTVLSCASADRTVSLPLHDEYIAARSLVGISTPFSVAFLRFVSTVALPYVHILLLTIMFARRFSRVASARWVRSVSTARGLSAILEKKPDDIVITFAKRTAMGRAKKGQLKDTPVDELLHALFQVCSTK